MPMRPRVTWMAPSRRRRCSPGPGVDDAFGGGDVAGPQGGEERRDGDLADGPAVLVVVRDRRSCA